MSRTLVSKVLPLLFLSMFCCDPVGAEGTEVIPITSATIVAFLPLALRSSKDGGTRSAISHLKFAVTDTSECLRPMKLVVRTVYTDRIVLEHDSRRETFDTSKSGQGIGAILAEPGRDARIVVSEIGPSALVHLLPRAASEYWHAPSCAKQGA